MRKDMSTTPSIPVQGEPRKDTGKVFLTGPGSCVVITDIDEEEALEWDRIVAARGGRC